MNLLEFWNPNILQDICGIFSSKYFYAVFIYLIQYLQIPDIKCKNVGIIIHMDRGLDPPPPMWTNMDILVTPLPPRPSTWFVDDPLHKCNRKQENILEVFHIIYIIYVYNY